MAYAGKDAAGETTQAATAEDQTLYEDSRSARDARALWRAEEAAERLAERLGGK